MMMNGGLLLRTVSTLGLVAYGAACDSPPTHDADSTSQAVGVPSTSQVPLDPATIPKFAHELTIPPVYAPTVITDHHGHVIRRDYTVSMAQTTVQMLPPGFPATTVLAYGGQVRVPGSNATTFARTVPGPTFESTRGIPNLVRWRNEITTPGFLPVDPTIHWANPQAIEPPLAPFNAFPPGYEDAQFPVAAVTHTHGLMVPGGHDGTAEEWFTAFGDVGPTYVSNDYLQPNDQPSTLLWYHGHTVGVTRLDVYSGLAGANILRDPGNPLDQAGTPLPSGPYEIPLVIQDRGFFTDGELNFARTGLNPQNPYWTVVVPSNTNVVNGRVWPNMNVDRRQYRFRVLIAPNERTYTLTFSNGMPFTVIGSDGGYLPQPKTVTSLLIGISERADILVDFSSFEPGTKIVLLDSSAPPATLGTVMQFTVNDTVPVPPAALPATLNTLPTLVADAPVRNKVLNLVRDAGGNVSVLVDGLHYTQPAIDYPLVGSTEQWNLIQNSAVTHLIHIHLIEFQVIGRQALNTTAYNQAWLVANGTPHLRSRPIYVDPTPFYVGDPIPPAPYETGWKDTVQAPGNQITRIMARWAPQALPTGGSIPGVNQFSIDPTTAPGYLIHCHLTGHEDHDMLRRMIVVNRWRPGVIYKQGTVVEYQGANYRVLEGHLSLPLQPPTARFDRWERVNNNDGSWAEQITYAVDDRVTYQGRLFSALQLHQARAGLEPTSAPQLWRELSTTACGQLTDLCAGNTNATAVACVATGQAAVEATCRTQLQGCLNVCQPEVHDSPCSGLCANPISFSVPDGTTFQSGNLGTGPACYETLSKIQTGTCTKFGISRTLRINGALEICNNQGWPAPLPSERNEGYCIQVTAGNNAAASFTAQ
jgi:spore coat protein A, manganese oxidase